MERIDYFMAKVQKEPGGCWMWMAYRDSDGYGRFGGDGGRVGLAHRWAYEYFIGPIPEGLTIDHLCRVRQCVNPEHMEPVTSRENNLRGNGFGANARKTHCVNGHPFDEANTYRQGHRRSCRVCNREVQRRKRAAAK